MFLEHRARSLFINFAVANPYFLCAVCECCCVFVLEVVALAFLRLDCF